MMILLWLGIAATTLELGMYTPWLIWHRLRTPLAIAVLILTVFSGAALAVAYPSAFTGVLLALCLMRAFNMARIVYGRMHVQYMHAAALRTGLVLMVLQLVTGGLWAAWHYGRPAGNSIWLGVAILQCGTALVLLFSVVRRLRHTAWPIIEGRLSDSELPTVTVAIPARNETNDLQLCLERIIASDYPKLEVIVLDDCSQTRRTPEIIRGFAHQGVRFIPGATPMETWLPKNQAYDRLAHEASGDYIVFCGVDIRFERQTLRSMITVMLEHHKQMLSILPDRAPEVRHHFSPAQALRYFWELAPPRRLFGRPAVLSSCWAIRKKALLQTGGFEAVRRSIVPEAYFARQLTARDGYSFMRAGNSLGVSSTKGNVEQRETAIRVRYPQLHRRPEQFFIVFSAELLLLVLPLCMAIGGYWLGIGLVATLLAAVASVILFIVHALIVRTTHISDGLAGALALPVVVLYDLGILCYSMWQYEFSTVDWRGRNICVPAMHVIPSLPKLD